MAGGRPGPTAAVYYTSAKFGYLREHATPPKPRARPPLQTPVPETPDSRDRPAVEPKASRANTLLPNAFISMKPKTMVAVKPEAPRSSVLVNNTNAQRSVIANGSDVMRCKRKIGYNQNQTYTAQPASVARRNARERNRVKQVNNGFATLRSHIPPSVAAAICTEKPSSRNSVASKKLSKVETLKMAVEYIRSLQELLEEHGGLPPAKSYEVDEERYYSSSPETVVSGETHYYPNSPDNYSKSEPSESGYYSPARTFKTENYPQFNTEMHESLTAEFVNARSPEPPEAHTHSFVQPRIRGSTSLSPPMSDAPSPTPSYASDNSGLHPGSTSSGKLASQLSRMTTAPLPLPPHKRSPPGYENYDNISAEDEELLDVISWWQQSN